MSHAQQLQELLRPLGPYGRQGVYSAGELAGEGHALDGVLEALDQIQREAMLDTAESWGLEEIEGLLAHRPVAREAPERRAALSALLRIGGDSFTLAAINDNLKGCGLNVRVEETDEAGVVEITFPNVPGIPEGFDRLRRIIEDIVPCHLEIRYVYWYINWAEAEEKYPTWGELEGWGYTWEELEKQVR